VDDPGKVGLFGLFASALVTGLAMAMYRLRVGPLDRVGAWALAYVVNFAILGGACWVFLAVR
jgi:hypothetical protein